MHKGIGKLVLVGLSLAAATAASGSGLRAHPGAPPGNSKCVVTATDTLWTRPGSQDLKVTTSDSLADPVTASFDMASKITVSSVVREAAAKTHRLTLDATEAVPGDWKLTLRGGMMECTGDVTVAASADTTRQ